VQLFECEIFCHYTYTRLNYVTPEKQQSSSGSSSPLFFMQNGGEGGSVKTHLSCASHVYVLSLLIAICKLTYDLKMAKNGRNMSS
jgi:hypothetical protein